MSASPAGGQPDLVVECFITKEPAFSCLSAKWISSHFLQVSVVFRGAVMLMQAGHQNGRNPPSRTILMGPNGINNGSFGGWRLIQTVS